MCIYKFINFKEQQIPSECIMNIILKSYVNVEMQAVIKIKAFVILGN
jgi:hypothetical protein